MQRTVPTVEEIFTDLPELETERLILRKLTLTDADDVLEYASDPLVARYTSWEPHKSIEDSRQFLTWVIGHYQNGEVSEWGLFHKADSKIIGTCGIVNWSTYNARSEIGYAMSRKYWGQGLMSEAAHAVIDFGFTKMHLNRVEARCSPANIGSARVMEKNGMSFEGILREQMYSKGRYEDLKMYSILRSEWQAQAGNK